MIAQDRQVRRFGALVDAALDAFAARWPLYLGLAIASLALQFPLYLRVDPRSAIPSLASALIDAFPITVVSLDVISRVLEEERLTLGALLRAALARWPVVAFVYVLATLFGDLVAPAVLGTPEETGYGLLAIPAMSVLGVLSLLAPLAAMERMLPLAAVPAFSMLRALGLVRGWPNLVRVTIAGAIVVPLPMASIMLEHALRGRGVRFAEFFAAVPLDALSVAAYGAFFAYLTLDLAARAKARE